jgi:geranylgeranyl diphosphate synthase type 3
MDLYLSDEDKLLTEPVKYYNDQKGKNIRKHILKVLSVFLNVEIKDSNNIDEIISIIHNASLVVDDIQDGSLLRRNQECAHIKYGIPLSINASYLCVFKILNEVNKRNDISENAKHKLIENIYYTHIGQGMDIYYTTHKIIPSLEDYNKMMEYKTGMLFYTILDLLMEKTTNIIIKKKYTVLRECLYNFALFFQIRDDYINVTDTKYWKERGFCQDFDEQKISYLVAYCTNNKLDNYEQINDLMKVQNKQISDKINILMLMKHNGLLDIIYDKLVELKRHILNTMVVNIIFEQLPFDKFAYTKVEEIEQEL